MTLCVAIAIPSVRHDAIGAERSNRWTFGSGTFIRFHTRGAKMSEFRDSSEGTRSEASDSAFSRREEEQPRGRRADRRKAAYGDDYARIATRLHFEPDDVVSCDVTFGVRVIPSSKKVSSCSGTLRISVRHKCSPPNKGHRVKNRGGFPHFVLSRNCVEKICRWGGVLYPTPPRCSGTLITFCRA